MPNHFPKKLHKNTPLVPSHPLRNLTGKTVTLKCDSLQPSGSFKDRGLGQLCIHYANQGMKGFVCSSGGNAGLAVAYASQVLKLPTTIVLPDITPAIMIKKLKAEGVKVLIEGHDWNKADQMAHQLAMDEGFAYIPPFNHPIIWEGHSSIVHEIKDAGLKPDAIITAVGGGGLMSGIAQGLVDVGWQDVAIITAETVGTASLYQAVQSKQRITLDKIDSVAVTLGAKQICEQAFEWTQKRRVLPEVVTDKAAVSACLRFADDHRQLVEPACGAALAILYDQHPVIEDFDNILVIICGGNAISLELLQNWKKQFKIDL